MPNVKAKNAKTLKEAASGIAIVAIPVTIRATALVKMGETQCLSLTQPQSTLPRVFAMPTMLTSKAASCSERPDLQAVPGRYTNGTMKPEKEIVKKHYDWKVKYRIAPREGMNIDCVAASFS